MRAISLWQPWATLLVRGIKKIETRHWDTKYRGGLIVHASQTRKGFREFSTEVLKHWSHELNIEFPLGAYVGIVNLYDTQSTEDIEVDERLYGNFEAGRFGWLCQNFREFTEPFPAKGQQGFWTPKPEVLTELLKRNAVLR